MPESTAVISQSSGTAIQPQPCRLKRVLTVMSLDASRKFGTLEEQVLTLAIAFRDRGSLLLPVFLTPLHAESQAAYAARGSACCRSRPAAVPDRHALPAGAADPQQRIEVVNWNFYPALTNGYFWALTVLLPHLEHYFTDHNSLTAEGVQRRHPRRAWYKRPLIRRYSRLLGVSDFILADMQERWRLPAVERFYHFVNVDRFRPDPTVRSQVRESLGTGDEFVIVVIAQLIADKGVAVAIRALSESPPDCRLWVIGDGPEAARLEGLARDLGVASRVRFLGLQRRVEPFLQAADALVCPSLWAEAAGLANIEAAACGLPVLASRIGGIPELVADGRTGLLFTPGRHQELAGLIRRLHDDPALRQTLGAAARAVAVEQFSAERAVEPNLAIYNC